MRSLLVLVLAAAGCIRQSSAGRIVTDLHFAGDQLVVERCELVLVTEPG